jgi:hypothetical protein
MKLAAASVLIKSVKSHSVDFQMSVGNDDAKADGSSNG